MQHCSSASEGNFAPAIDHYSSQAIGGQCQPKTAPITALRARTIYFTGRTFMSCGGEMKTLMHPINGSDLDIALRK